VEGARSVRAACLAGVPVQELYIAPELLGDGRDADLVAAAERSGADVVELGAQAFASLTERRPDGLLAVVRRPATALDSLDPPADPLVAVAVAIERPGNLGAIARTACAAGVDALVVADTRTDAFHRDTIRGSVGAVFSLCCVAATTAEALGWLREREIRLVATTPVAAIPYWAVSYEGALAVAVGGERHGLTEHLAGHSRRERLHPCSRPGRQPQRRGCHRRRVVRSGTEPLRQPVDPLTDRFGTEPLEELLRIRAARFREQDLAAELREELRELLRVARLVEQVGAED